MKISILELLTLFGGNKLNQKRTRHIVYKISKYTEYLVRVMELLLNILLPIF